MRYGFDSRYPLHGVMAEWFRQGSAKPLTPVQFRLTPPKLNMQNILNYIQIAVAVLLIASILLQNRGTSLGGAFGGEGNVYRSRRGAEKFLFYSTVVLAIIFVALAVAHIIL